MLKALPYGDNHLCFTCPTRHIILVGVNLPLLEILNLKLFLVVIYKLELYVQWILDNHDIFQLIKVPLFIHALKFVFYQYNAAPT